MEQKAYLIITAVLSAIVALAHLGRLLVGLEVIVGGDTVPMWVSGLGVVVPAALAGWAVRILAHTPGGLR